MKTVAAMSWCNVVAAVAVGCACAGMCGQKPLSLEGASC